MKKSLAILPLVLCIFISCHDKQGMTELKELKAQKELEEQNKVIIRKMYEGWNNRNTDVMIELHAPNAKYHHPTIGAKPILFEEAMEQMKMLWDAFPDITINIEDLFAEENKVVVRFIGRGTHTKDFGGIPAKGIKTEAGGVEIFHIKENKIVEVWEISDRLGLMQQLGMELRLTDEAE